jgi:hypothetical protein
MLSSIRNQFCLRKLVEISMLGCVPMRSLALRSAFDIDLLTMIERRVSATGFLSLTRNKHCELMTSVEIEISTLR